MAARSRLNPAAGVMLSALWVADSNQLVLVVHHLAVDAVSWWILLEDLNIAWAQHREGHEVALPASGTSYARWAELLAEHAGRPQVVHAGRRLETGGGGHLPGALPAVNPAMDTYATAGHLSMVLDAETHPPTAFRGADRVSCRDPGHLVDCVRVGGRGILGQRQRADRHRRGGPRPPRGAGPPGPVVDLSHTVGWFTTKYPVALTLRPVGGLRWAQVIAGEAALGALIKDAKEQLRALPDPLTYGLLRYLNSDVDLGGSDPVIGFNYFGRVGALGADVTDGSGDGWRLSADGSALIRRAAAVPMPLVHTVDLNAVTIDTDTGWHLQANWTWAPSALDHAAITRLGQLWFEALAGICAHVRGGGGGLTPSDIAPARLSQQQIDELAAAIRDRRYFAVDPAAAGAALSRQHRAGQLRRCLCGATEHHRDRPA